METIAAPAGGACKHVVAVLLAAMEQVKQRKVIPVLDPDDNLYLELAAYLKAEADDDEAATGNCSATMRDAASNEIASMLQSKSRDELLKLVVVIARDFPEVACWLHERKQMALLKELEEEDAPVE